MSDEGSNKRLKTEEMKRVLVFGGKTGWIGQLMVGLAEKEGAKHHIISSHIISFSHSFVEFVVY